MVLVLPYVRILVIQLTHVCTFLDFVVSDKVRSRGKGYLIIFFRFQLSPQPFRMTIATYLPLMLICPVTFGFVDNSLLYFSDDQLTCLC